MTDQEPKKKNQKKNFDYWMGQVDSKLDSIFSLLSAQSKNWDKFIDWQNSVNERLALGSHNFSIHDKKLTEIELSLNSHIDNDDKHTTEEKERKYLNWPWFLDNIFAPVLKYGIIIFITYLLITQVPVSIF